MLLLSVDLSNFKSIDPNFDYVTLKMTENKTE